MPVLRLDNSTAEMGKPSLGNQLTSSCRRRPLRAC